MNQPYAPPEPPELPELGQWGSLEELYALQDRLLAAALERAHASPFLKPRLAGSGAPYTFDGLAALPFTTKQDLRDAYPFGMLAVDRRELATYHESSGTSGEPTASYFTDADWHDVVSRFVRSAVDLSPADTVMVRTPYAMLTTAHQAHRAARLRGATVVPADNRSLVTPYARVVRSLRDLEVTVAWCLPSEALLWAAAARAAGLDPACDFPALRAFLVAGEPLTEARRARMSELWGGIPVLQDYGSTETGSLAGECPEGRLHLWADRFVAEVYDPATGRSSREGRGRLVVTTLHRAAMPLVRYDLEDTVEVSGTDCGCGWRLPVIRVLGRSAGGVPVGPVRVVPHQLERLVFELPGVHGVLFWRARAAGERLEIEIEVAPDHREAACAGLADAVRARLGVPCEVRGVPAGTVVPLETLTRGHEFVKPRSLFAAGEDWDKALVYY
ncbi:phenylacetate--CoA ligase family protein [Streptomyces aurantiogriseus]|uniref:Phenylacetate--CoA ligase n=1 Tax=Streptomyces aurantiogriseus TaxID=66870 RepID=A0A918C2Q7_9ACTN|nr:AMP-binding protein [Streptomyces aurantiogriseus]GGR02690.1 phenylacetate--CoA ligase [Streptomyces aurantiogriseus]